MCFFLLLSFQKETLSDIQLHLAALRGDIALLKKVLESGKVHVDSRDEVIIRVNNTLFESCV